MPKKWTRSQERFYWKQLNRLYVKKNLSIREIASVLGIAQQTIFQRMQRLGVKSTPHLKNQFQKKRDDIYLPKVRNADLAEFFGIMLGDGGLSHFQIFVHLGNKELSYAQYICTLIKKLFSATPKISTRKSGYRTVYLGSVLVARWLLQQGLVYNKVQSQVGVPNWIFQRKDFMRRFIRGFFDTDGSVYRLKFGIQLSFTNKSLPLLQALHSMFTPLGYKTSDISGFRFYLTKKSDIIKFFSEIDPKNPKHWKRLRGFNSAPVV